MNDPLIDEYNKGFMTGYNTAIEEVKAMIKKIRKKK